MIEFPKRIMTIQFFFIYFYFKGPISWKKYASNSHATTDQKVEDNKPLFLGKNWGLLLSTFLSETWFGLKSISTTIIAAIL